MPAPRVSFVSLGCPKALVDSERIITRLRAEGYEIARKHDGADLVVVNTCGFLDSARDESLAAIGEAMKENGKVIALNRPMVVDDYLRTPRITHRYNAIIAAGVLLGIAAVTMLWIKEPPIVRDVDELTAMPSAGH